MFVGLLAGALIGFSIQHPVESPFAAADAKAAMELREQLADVDAQQPDLNFWRPLCTGSSPLCAAYVAGLVQANTSFLQKPLFCPQDMKIHQIERRFTEDLEWAKDKPEAIKAKPGVFAAATWNFAMPCGEKPLIEQDQDKPDPKPTRKKARG
jgi:hypothetical protein